MQRRLILALSGAILAFVLLPGAAALATTVTVRVEAKTHTLLSTTTINTRTGFITKGGAPAGVCPKASAAGALDSATHGNWSGKFYTSFGDYLISSILGETESGKQFFWGFYKNNRFASLGLCKTELRSGDQLLLAAIPTSGTEYPIVINAPRSARVAHSFAVKVVWFNAKGLPKALAGAKVSVGGSSVVTNSHGILHVLPTKTGTIVLGAHDAGYIRAGTVRVSVTG